MKNNLALYDCLAAFVHHHWGGAIILPDAFYKQTVNDPKDDALPITDAELHSRYLEPWLALSFEQAQIATRKISSMLSHKHGYVLTAQQMTNHKALQWTIVDAYNTGLFDLFPTPLEQPPLRFGNDSLIHRSTLQRELQGPEYSLPHQQCHHCGRTGTDPRGVPFGKKDLRYCHQASCSSSGNPQDHDEHCCFRNWKRHQETLRKSLTRNAHNHEHSEQIFHKYLLKRYALNHGKIPLVQVAHPKPPHLRKELDPYRVQVIP